jgi:hypothetical protein
MAAVSHPSESHNFTPSNFLFPKSTLMLTGKRFNDVLYIQEISQHVLNTMGLVIVLSLEGHLEHLLRG